MPNQLIDAMLLARRFLSQHPALLAHRLSPTDPALAGAAPVAIVIDEPDEEVSLRAFVERWVARRRNLDRYPIETFPVPQDLLKVVADEDGKLKVPSSIRGLVGSYPDHADILLVADLGRCWTRFTICKELAHLIMGAADGTRISILKVQLQMALQIGLEKPPAELAAEEFAWYVAAELMAPFEERQAWSPSDDDMTLARRYLMPRTIVELLRSEDYQAIAREASGRLGEAA